MPDNKPAAPPDKLLADWIRRDYAALAESTLDRDAATWARTTCRACGAGGLSDVLSLGVMPPANAFLNPAQLSAPEPRFPLDLMLCEHCGMVQLRHVVPPELLFRAYSFFTSMSMAMSAHFAALMNDHARRRVPPGGLVVEVGSNDGTALSSIQRRDVRVLGVDPARNVSVMAAARGVPTVAEFFTEPLAREIRRVAGPASLIVGCNVLGHIDDLDQVCRGIDALLAPEGAFVFEVPYLGKLLENVEFDTVYHEHLSYFAVRPLVALFSRHGLRLDELEMFPVHGGTIRGVVVRGEGCSDAVSAWIDAEERAGMATPAPFRALAARTAEMGERLRAWLAGQKAHGRRIWGYGAPAKGTVLLNHFAIGTDLLPVVVDSTPAKQGLHVPGTRQPILAPAEVAAQRPDAVLVLAWNHAREIFGREAAYRAVGGHLLTPDLREIGP